jgi:putative chitinase
MSILDITTFSHACGITSLRASQWLQSINEAMSLFEINTPARQTMFLAQIGHESTNFSTVVENLNYSSQGLLSVFPKHFTDQEAILYARQPIKIANKVYASRDGNSDESSGDGWKYRGRGLIQITFKNNYQSTRQGLINHSILNVPDFINYPDFLINEKWAALSAAEFWYSHGCNELADKGAFIGTTRVINGPALQGLTDRTKLWSLAKSIIPVN